MNVIPLLVRSFGRSGTTLMMQLLGTSQNVLFERTYPFETRYLTYLCRIAQLVSSQQANDGSWNEETLLHWPVARIGPIPYVDSDFFDRNRLVEGMVRSSWKEFADAMNKTAVDDRLPVFYAEKVALDLPDLVNRALFAKNLFLFRDPRDEFISIKTFNAKRGYLAFGWEKDDTDLSFAERLCDARLPVMNFLASIPERDERTIVVYYERLSADPASEVVRLVEWLGIELDWGAVAAQRDAYAHHMTTATLQESVCRWKSQLSPEIKELFTERLGDQLQKLGYQLS